MPANEAQQGGVWAEPRFVGNSKTVELSSSFQVVIDQAKPFSWNEQINFATAEFSSCGRHRQQMAIGQQAQAPPHSSGSTEGPTAQR